MKKHLTVLQLCARCTVLPLCGLIVLTAALQGGLFWWAMHSQLNADRFGLEFVFEGGGLYYVFVGAVIVLAGLLSSALSRSGSQTSYTLRRLMISPRWVFFWQWVYNLLAVLLFWLAEIVLVLGLCRLFLLEADPALVTGQTVFLAFHRSDFLHFLLPLENGWHWAALLSFGVAFAACTAYYPCRSRRRGWNSILPTLAILLLTAKSYDENPFWTGLFIFFALALAAIGLYPLVNWSGKEEAYEEETV